MLHEVGSSMGGRLALALQVTGLEQRGMLSSMQRGALQARVDNLNRTSSDMPIGASIAVLDYLTARIAWKNRWSMHVRELGVRPPLEASLQYPQDSLL